MDELLRPSVRLLLIGYVIRLLVVSAITVVFSQASFGDSINVTLTMLFPTVAQVLLLSIWAMIWQTNLLKCIGCYRDRQRPVCYNLCTRKVQKSPM